MVRSLQDRQRAHTGLPSESHSDPTSQRNERNDLLAATMKASLEKGRERESKRRVERDGKREKERW